MEKTRISTVLLYLESKDKRSAIQEMINRCSAMDKREILNAVLAREEKLSTYIGDGISIPHAKCSCIKDGEAIIARSKEGIDWTNGKSHIIVLVLSPMDIEGAHVVFLSEIVRVLSSQENRDRIMEAERVEDILEVFDKL